MNSWKEFVEELNSGKLELRTCSKCSKPLLPYFDKDKCWVEYLVCLRCFYAGDYTR